MCVLVLMGPRISRYVCACIDGAQDIKVCALSL